jgi:hypothetical protein
VNAYYDDTFGQIGGKGLSTEAKITIILGVHSAVIASSFSCFFIC